MLGLDLKAAGFWVPKPTWTDKDIPDLTGKVIVVTGANTGIGKASAELLLQHGARVYAACRSKEKAEKAIEEIKAATGKTDIHFLQLDLGDIPSSIAAGKELVAKETRLDVALLSAGVMTPPKGSKSAQGYELQFGTNVIGHYAFVEQLGPLLAKTAKEAGPAAVRVIWVSSSGHFALAPKSGIDYAAVEQPDSAKVSQWNYYGFSKLGNVFLANAMAERLRADGIFVGSLHPGNIRSDLQRGLKGLEAKVINLLLNPISLGVLTQLYAATSKDLTMQDTGAYFVPWARKYKATHPLAYDQTAIKQAVDFTEKAIKKHSASSSS